MTATSPDLDVLHDLDFDPTLPCDSTKAPDGCPEAATYRYTATCPNGHPTTWFYCTPHAEEVARYLPQVYSMYCDCGWHAIVRLGEIATLEPL